jgi:hypothetical protein
MRLFKKKVRLANGQRVCEGDKVQFIDRFGKLCKTKVVKRTSNVLHAKRDEMLLKGSLYIWNNRYAIDDYLSAERI